MNAERIGGRREETGRRIGRVNRNTWPGAIEAWCAWLRAGAVRPATVELRGLQMRRVAREIGGRPWSVTVDDLSVWLGGHAWSVETVRSHRAALRSFYGWAHSSGLIRTDPSRLLRSVKAATPYPRPASDAAVSEARLAADDRVLLMIELGAHGLRRGEIARAHTAGLSQGVSGWALEVDGKGGKRRTVPVTDSLARSLRALPPGWVFPSNHGGHLTPAYVGKLISRVLPQHVTPHQLRHRFATRAYAGTRDIEAVRQLLGHASVATTQRYVAIEPEALRAAVIAAA